MQNLSYFDPTVGERCADRIAIAIVVTIIEKEEGKVFLSPISSDEAESVLSNCLNYEMKEIGLVPALEKMCEWNLGFKKILDDQKTTYLFDLDAVQKFSQKDWNYRGSRIYKTRAFYSSYLQDILDEERNLVDELYRQNADREQN